MKKPVVVSSDSYPNSSLLVHESKPFKNLNKRSVGCMRNWNRLDAKELSYVLKRRKNPVLKRSQIQTRGFSLGPNEIMLAAVKSKQSGMTPVESMQNRRKSCFWKSDDIEEEKCGFPRRKNSNLRQVVTTVRRPIDSS
ncbi:hypothetical protein Hanom_Chr01g00071221 [Helianthus anomalus]